MSLRADRCTFTYNLALLILQAWDLGLQIAADWVRRCPDCTVGKLGKLSRHAAPAMAGDMLIYDDLDGDGEDDDYVKDTESYRELGEYWESLNPRNRWGGRYGDGNHFEMLDNEWRT